MIQAKATGFVLQNLGPGALLSGKKAGHSVWVPRGPASRVASQGEGNLKWFRMMRGSRTWIWNDKDEEPFAAPASCICLTDSDSSASPRVLWSAAYKLNLNSAFRIWSSRASSRVAFHPHAEACPPGCVWELEKPPVHRDCRFGRHHPWKAVWKAAFVPRACGCVHVTPLTELDRLVLKLIWENKKQE